MAKLSRAGGWSKPTEKRSENMAKVEDERIVTGVEKDLVWRNSMHK